MAKKTTTTIEIDEQIFIIPKLNIDQLERLTTMWASPDDDKESRKKLAFDTVKLGLERATPPADWAVLGIDMDELTALMRKVLQIAGVQTAENPPKPPADETAAGK